MLEIELSQEPAEGEPRSTGENSLGTIDSLLRRPEVALLNLRSQMEKSDYTPDIGVSPVIFSQVSLPHSKPKGNPEVWSRTNGAYTMKVLPHLHQDPVTGAVERQFPYGTNPRLLIAHLTTRAAKTGSRTVDLGSNLSDLGRMIGLSKGGTTHDSMRKQLARVFGSQIRFEVNQSSDFGEQKSEAFFTFADTHHEFLPRPGMSRRGASEWLNEVVLSEPFYKEVISRSLPIDMNVMRHLTTSMTMDVYLWVTHRAPLVQGTARVRWDELSMQFGHSYSNVYRFRSEFRIAIELVSKAYSGLKYDASDQKYMQLFHSPTAVPRNAKSRMNAFTSGIITKEIQQ